MKKILPLILILVIAIVLWFAITSRGGKKTADGSATPTAQSQSHGNDAAATSSTQDQMGIDKGVAAKEPGEAAKTDEAEQGAEDDMTADTRPATEVFSTAEDALKAVKAGASDFNDLILEQFTQLGENCTWCGSFYSSIRELALSPETPADQRGYYAEILAVSGRVENIKTLVDSIKNSKNQDEADVYAEALEFTVGRDEVVKYLGDQLTAGNQTLRDAAVAAITNQGSRLATEILYNNTVQQGDPDGYYSMGIGLGEVVPDEEAWPFLQEAALKRDQYSHLAVKALMNAGLEGLRLVTDMMSNSPNPDFDQEILKTAKEHVAFDDDTIAYIKAQAETQKNPYLQTFFKDLATEYAQSETDTAGEDEGTEQAPEVPPFTPLNPGTQGSVATK